MADKAKRPGVMLYFDDIKPAINRMDDEQCGRLLRAIVSYAETGEKPEIDGVEGLVFDMLTPKIDRDGERYEENREQRQYAVYVRERKRAGEAYLPISEWRLSRLSSGNIGPIPSDNGRYPSTIASTSASTIASTLTSTTAEAARRGSTGGFRGEEGETALPSDAEEKRQRAIRMLEENYGKK